MLFRSARALPAQPAVPMLSAAAGLRSRFEELMDKYSTLLRSGYCIAMTIRGQFRPLAKKELLKIPVFGWVTKATCVVVDRNNSESRKKSIGFLKKILGFGISILIFPEGTQNRTNNLLQPFRDGAFRIAVDTQQSIMPLAVVGAKGLMPPGTLQLKPGLIKILVGHEIRVTPGSDSEQLKEQARLQIEQMLLAN